MASKAKAKSKTADVPAPYPGDKNWQAEDDMRTLSRAAEIKMDKSRMKAAKECATHEMKKLGSITVEESRQGVKE